MHLMPKSIIIFTSQEFRSSDKMTSSQKQGLVMIAVVFGLMTLPMMY
ncbi:hypothetical protein JCM19233_7258 [Vibrio astriarenae]|nr:hypothetical protein JCM19233_7258 [Vibrio sp. C7]